MGDAPDPLGRYRVVSELSAVIVRARSNVGDIEFVSTAIRGGLEVAVDGGVVDLSHPPSAHLEVRLDGLASGNALYDAELHRRLNVRRFPAAKLDLADVRAAGTENRYEVRGSLALHGVARDMSGIVEIAVPAPGTIVIRGEQTVDMRDFDLAAPGMLLLRIFPDVRVTLDLACERDDGRAGSER